MKKGKYRIDIDVSDKNASLEELVSRAASFIEDGEVMNGSLSDGYVTVSWGNDKSRSDYIVGYVSCCVGVPASIAKMGSADFNAGFAAAYAMDAQLDQLTANLLDK